MRNDRMKLFVAFNYGGRAEIVDAAERYGGGGEEEFAQAAVRARDVRSRPPRSARAARAGCRTSCSGRPPTPSSYFADVLWPDFDEEHLVTALEDLRGRGRRYGAR